MERCSEWGLPLSQIVVFVTFLLINEMKKSLPCFYGIPIHTLNFPKVAHIILGERITNTSNRIKLN